MHTFKLNESIYTDINGNKYSETEMNQLYKTSKAKPGYYLVDTPYRGQTVFYVHKTRNMAKEFLKPINFNKELIKKLPNFECYKENYIEFLLKNKKNFYKDELTKIISDLMLLNFQYIHIFTVKTDLESLEILIKAIKKANINLNKLDILEYPFFSFFISSENNVALIQYLLEIDIDFNRNLKDYGTFLHVLAANEDTNKLLEYIKLLVDYRKKTPKNPFNFACKDKLNGRTILMLATILGLTKVCLELIQQNKLNNIDIGLNELDNHGASALMYAAMLGRFEIFEALLNAKAKWDLVDHQKRALPFYINSSDDLIKKTLLNFSTHPDRCISFTKSYFLTVNGQVVTYKSNAGKEEWLVLSPKEEHVKRLESLKVWFAHHKDTKEVEHIENVLLNLSRYKYTPSVFEQCLAGQVQIKEFYSQFVRDLQCFKQKYEFSDVCFFSPEEIKKPFATLYKHLPNTPRPKSINP